MKTVTTITTIGFDIAKSVSRAIELRQLGFDVIPGRLSRLSLHG